MLTGAGSAAHAQASPQGAAPAQLPPGVLPPPPPPRPALTQVAATPVRATPPASTTTAAPLVQASTAQPIAAQSAVQASAPAYDEGTSGPTLVRAEECAPRERRGAMNSYAFGMQIGIGRVSAGDVPNPTYTPALVDLANQLTPAQMEQAGLSQDGEACSPLDRRCHTSKRSGLQLSFPIQLGGAGVAFRVEPTFTFAKSAKSYGLYVGPTFSYRVLDPLYLGFGLGLKAAWVNADAWKYGGDFQGRIPLTGTYYVSEDVALVLEFAYGGGVSVFANDPRTVRNPLTGAVIDGKTPEATFGLGRSWDLTVGVRFP